MIHKLLLIQHVRLKTDLKTSPKPLHPYTIIYFYTQAVSATACVPSEKTHHHKNKRQGKLSNWQSLGNPTTFKQINTGLCTHKHPQTRSASTCTHMHTDTNGHPHLPELRNTVNAVIHAPPRINQRFHLLGGTPASFIAPNYWGPGSKVSSHSFTPSHHLGRTHPLFPSA